MFVITFTMIFSGGLIPTYLLVRGLGILNTRWVMRIPNANRRLERHHHPHLLPEHHPR